MSTIMKQNKTLLEKVMFAFSVLFFGLLNLVPGLVTGGSFADAQYGGGGGGGGICPDGCPGGKTLCCTLEKKACKPGPEPGSEVCVTSTYYYYKT